MEDMDITCGGINDATESVQQVGARIFQRILECASGEKSKREELGTGKMNGPLADWCCDLIDAAYADNLRGSG